jgi:Flp pilus assembly protein TadD
MKRFLVVLLCISLAGVLAGCSSGSDATSQKSNASASSNYKDTLKEYEKFVDDYVALMKKYKTNPSDPSILSDYTSMMTDYSEWTNKINDIKGDFDSEDLKTLTRINEKLASVLT